MFYTKVITAIFLYFVYFFGQFDVQLLGNPRDNVLDNTGILFNIIFARVKCPKM